MTEKNLKQLNPKQRQAVEAITGPLLIIAGAGSGKTRVITFRIANMLDHGIPQASILALTFTNKAAKEMADRVKEVTGKKLSNLTVSTFHAFGVKVLRKSIRRIKGYKENFSIYDQNDKKEAIKNAARELSLSAETLDLNNISNIFSGIKTERLKWDNTNDVFKPLYDEYEKILKAYNAVDFDDLIVKPIKILEDHPDILEEYRQRYKYIMVDEFQDTSGIQYKLMKMLSEINRNICVVGDDDQSIYSWRGADYNNIINFEKDFSELVEIKLEQNYRSSENILAAANNLIANNKNRKEKNLWTGSGKGHSIEICYPENEHRESGFITDMIQMLALKEKTRYQDIGILVRTNNLTASIEEALLSENIPYKVSGGMSFFQRKEIRDVISYLRVIANPDDDVSLLRIINTPRRSLGRVSLTYIRDYADSKNYSIYSSLNALRFAADSKLTDKAKESIDIFINMIEFYREKFNSKKNMAKNLRSLVEEIDYWSYLVMEHQKNDKLARWKFSNINKFIDFFERWEKDPDNLDPSLFSYLSRISLVTRDDDENDDNKKGKVNLMTIHAAKGLEFDIVFLPGVEDRIIPHERSIVEDDKNIEEERRLFYVAITRAKKKLYISACQRRRIMRELVDSVPSRFLDEIPVELLVNHVPESEVETHEALDIFKDMKSKFK